MDSGKVCGLICTEIVDYIVRYKDIHTDVLLIVQHVNVLMVADVTDKRLLQFACFFPSNTLSKLLTNFSGKNSVLVQAKKKKTLTKCKPISLY